MSDLIAALTDSTIQKRSSMDSQIRVAVAVGPHLLCDALVARLQQEQDLHVIAAPGMGTSTIAAIRSLNPAIVVLDPEASNDPDLKIVDSLRSAPPRPAVVGLVSKGSGALAARLVRDGALATVIKTAPAADLVTAIRCAFVGEGWISPPLIRDVVEQLHGKGTAGNQRLRSLTPREREVVQLMVDGLGRQQIATKLYLSVDTIRTHMRTIMDKLGVHSATEVVSIALQDGYRPHA